MLEAPRFEVPVLEPRSEVTMIEPALVAAREPGEEEVGGLPLQG
jgi:hypothetical protein